MAEFLYQLIEHTADVSPQSKALKLKDNSLNYQALWDAICQTANAFCHCGLKKQERVAIYLPKQFATVISFFATSKAGGVFVPVNPTLKGPQVAHILNDCDTRILVTSHTRLKSISKFLADCESLHTIICVDDIAQETIDEFAPLSICVMHWNDLKYKESRHHRVIDTDMVCILYTSGSTGKPKGVVLSHRNMLAGAKSVANYLENTPTDRILAVLPFSFDYGFSQLSTAFYVGACVVMMDYLLPRDVIKMVAKEKITALAAVPPLWIQLAQLEWPEDAVNSLRYISNSGGAMPLNTLKNLRTALPNTLPYLMYGLTEAFRSTYLPPHELDNRPESMGKAIPNVEVLVVRPDGTHCDPDEPGELIHKGSLVALGYWNDPEKTVERFKPAPMQEPGLPMAETAVWSGDTVRMDKDGFLYFVGRKDDMIKTSGYRVSPAEVEEILYASGLVGEAVALGIPHPNLGQTIVVIATAIDANDLDIERLFTACRQTLPNYMVPTEIIAADHLPRNANGKIDRKQLSLDQQHLFQEPSS
ncbi:MAG: acyl-CoA ligase (AMP-forming), exosortase A system-associated [Thiohalomonadales bacterium]